MTNTCPRDHSILVAKGTSIAGTYYCSTCHGLWIPSTVVAAVIGQPTQLPTLPSRSKGIQAATVCPEDGNPLVTFLFRGVELDICSACHGVWLDRGELEYIKAKQSGTTPSVPASESQVSSAITTAVAGIASSVPNVDVSPDLILLAGDVGTQVIAAVVSNPDVMNAVAASAEAVVNNMSLIPDAVGGAAEVAPDIVQAVIEFIAQVFSS